MHAREIREMETHAILDQIEAKRKELYLRRLDFAANKLEDTNELRKLRRELARMLTIIRERELAAEFVAKSGPVDEEIAEERTEVPAEAQAVQVEEQPVETENTEGEADHA